MVLTIPLCCGRGELTLHFNSLGNCSAWRKIIGSQRCNLSIGSVRYIQIFQHDLRLSAQTSIFGGVFYASKSLLKIATLRKKLLKIAIWLGKPRIHVRILISRTSSVKTSKMSVYNLIGVNEEYFINIEFFFFLYFLYRRKIRRRPQFLRWKTSAYTRREANTSSRLEWVRRFVFFSLKLLSTLLRH